MNIQMNVGDTGEVPSNSLDNSQPIELCSSRKRRHSECNNVDVAMQSKQKNKRRSLNADLPLSTAPSNEVSNPVIPFNQVESELEKMFAGIIENNTDPAKSNGVVTTDASAEVGDNVNEICDKKTVPAIKNKKKRTLMKASMKKQNSAKKLSKKSKTNDASEFSSDVGTVVARPKVPSIHLKDQRNNPLNISITNSFREEEEEKGKEKKKGNSNIFNYRSKNVQAADLYNSTLSLRYDAQTADLTWMCVFCKKGPHYLAFGEKPKVARFGVLSDLFGPYFIKQDASQGVAVITETDKKMKKTSKNSKRASSCSISEKPVDYAAQGMRKVAADEPKWEVWLHDQCAIWATNVYITGNKLTGLQDAVWNAFNSTCKVCQLTGANISCMHRSCNSMTHYICGVTSGWLLNSEEFVAKCDLHKNL